MTPVITCSACGTAWADGASACARCGGTERDAGRTTALTHPPMITEPDELIVRVRQELGRDYDVHSELGRGGMAIVYKATELELLRPVALKVLPPEYASSAAVSERFRREARTAASFDHPNIIPIYRVGQAGGLFYIAMKFVEGRSLDDVLQAQGPLPIAVVLHVLRAATRALAFAHQNNVVHRDIKGANILIDQDGRVVVSDFGIARAGEDAGLTATGMLMGTPYFMSPEQCAGHRVGQQSDQYSLGIVAFQMLTGTVPFRAETIPGVMQHHFFTPVPDVRQVRTDVPPALVDVVNRALAKRAADRYGTTQEMQAAVDAIPFTETDRREGEALVRDLVLGVGVPKVDAGVLPPLAETMMMTPPPVARARAASERKRRRRGLVAGGIAGTLAVATVAFALGSDRGGAADRAATERTQARLDSAISSAAPVSAPPVVAAATDTATRDTTTVDTSSARSTPAVAARPSAVDRRPAPTPVDARALAATTPAVTGPAPEAAAPGRLRVRVYPSDADIRIDGRLLGRGVVLDSAVAAGARRLRASAPGYLPLDTLIQVTSGETAQVGTVRLLPIEGKP